MRGVFNFLEHIKGKRNMVNKSEITGAGRLDWLDALKGFAIIAVVIGHVLLGFVENKAFPDVNQNMKSIMDWIYTWHMPLFFALSGFTYSLSCLNSTSINTKKIKIKALNLVAVYLFFSIALGGLKIVFAAFVDNPMDIEKFFKGLLFPNTLMWYLWVLAFYYVFFIKIIRIKSNIILAFLFITMLFLGRIGDELTSLRLCVKNFLCCAGYFYIGIWIEKKRKIPQYFGLVSVLIAGCFGFFYFAHYNTFGFMPLVVRIILESLNAAAVTILCFFIFMEYAVGSHFKVLRQWGVASLVIYLTHTYVVTAMKVVIIRIGFSNGFIAVISTWIVGMVIPYIIWKVSNRVRWIGYVFNPVKIFNRGMEH